MVLPETLTYFNSGLTPAEAAETVPGPTTEYFGELAKQHNLYIVAGLFERDAYKVYNVAVLLTPDGTVGGKFRKVTLPDSEAQAGSYRPGLPRVPDALRHARDDGVLRRVFPRGCARTDEARRGGDCVAGVGLQPRSGSRTGAPRITSIPVSSTYEDINAQLDAVRGVGSRRTDARGGKGLGERRHG